MAYSDDDVIIVHNEPPIQQDGGIHPVRDLQTTPQWYTVVWAHDAHRSMHTIQIPIRLNEQVVATQMTDQLLTQQLLSTMMSTMMPTDAVVQARRMGPGLLEAMIMQEVLMAALEQQPLTAEALGLLHKGHVHVLEMHADGSVSELMPPDTPVPQEVAELQRFKQLVNTLQQQRVGGPQQHRAARLVALGACLLLITLTVWAWTCPMSDWADVLRHAYCKAVICWRRGVVAPLTAPKRPIMADGAHEGGRGALPAWKQQRGTRQQVAVRAMSGVRMPRARPAGASGSLDD